MTPVVPRPFVRAVFLDELAAIRQWWLDHGLDRGLGGVHGQIDADNRPAAGAAKGAVLHLRVLWFLTECTLILPDRRTADAAHDLYHYVRAVFLDTEHGGVRWSVDAAGQPCDCRKQIYAQAFAIYAFSSYARAFGDGEAAILARDIAMLVERHGWDRAHGGYVEAFDAAWSPVAEWRLSPRDLNLPKTMNTHLHIVEAYTELHRQEGSEWSAGLLAKALDIFLMRFVSPRGGQQLSLFYTMEWADQCGDVSFGHGIEAAWLLYEAAEALAKPNVMEKGKAVALALGEGALSGLTPFGGLNSEKRAGLSQATPEHHWWVQAEALVGFWNAYQLSGDVRFKNAAQEIWRFIQNYQIDRVHGEWLWRSQADNVDDNSYKAGFWKGPYHNGRAMIEMARRLEKSS